MVVDRIFLERPGHRVVGAERSEPFPQSERRAVVAEVAPRGGDQLVEIGVWMPAVHVALAMNARVELAPL
jgi:hypothetical protein